MGAALKLFTGDSAPDALDGTNRRPAYTDGSTLREAYLERAHVLAAVSPATARNYLQALDWWGKLTANPALDQLRQSDVSAFRADLQSIMPASTANKHLRSLRTILGRLGPPSARYPDALDLLAKPVFVKLLPEADPQPVHFSDDELNALWLAAKYLIWPRVPNVVPPAFWRGVLVCGVTYGPRVGDLLNLDRENVYDVGGKLWIRWEAQKTAKTHTWPLNAAVARALEHLGPGKLLRCPNNPAKLYATFRTWCAAAGIHRADPLSFHALRSTAAKRYDAYSRGLGAVILGHAVEKNVTNKHYLGDAALADAYDAIRNIPQPERFIAE